MSDYQPRPEPDSEWEALWVEEAARRADRLRDGDTTTHLWGEVLLRLRERLDGNKEVKP